MRWSVLLFLLVPALASAQNPAWPNRSATVETLRDPANWPDDPDYGYDITRAEGGSCIGEGLRCWTNATGGQWNFWSWVPPQTTSVEGWRSDEEPMGSGTWTDLAWTRTTGDRRVVIAILDSGINWDERDLVNQYYISYDELAAEGLDVRCLPEGLAGGPPGFARHDRDGDGTLSMRDWFFGLEAAAATTLANEIDGMGNQNGVAEPGDLITFCSDGVDDDGNGYVDDISGWDFYMDDNDPNDDTRFGHGTGEARWSAAAGNNGIGKIGYCPNCSILMVRAGESFIADVQDFGESVVFAVDSGAKVIQEALGSINHSTFMRRAMDYAYANGVLTVASAADENSYHHNFPGTADHNLYIHAIRFAGATPQTSESFLAFNNCTNYGGQLAMSAPGTGCSSEATAVGAGIAGLIASAGIAADRPGGPLDPVLSAEEMRQLITMQADDIFVPESDPAHPEHDDRYYPSREGWDQRFGWGRINAFRAVDAVWRGAIPPEVDLYYPDWFRVLYPSRDGSVSLRGSIDARRAESFDYVVEWAAGIEPEDDDFEVLAMGTGQTERIEGQIASWDISSLNIDNDEGQGPHNRFTVTVRVRVTANYGGAIGSVRGEQRRVYSLAPDATLKPGFPLALGTRHESDLHPGASGESSPKLVNLDDDPALEIVYGDADGLLHAINGDATELPGFPVRLGTLRSLTPSYPDNVLGSVAYASGDVPTADLASSILSTPAIGDLDGNGTIEIVAVTMEGDLYVVEPDGSIREGWPVGLPDVLSGDARRGGPPNRDSVVERGAFASPALVDLDDDDALEIVLPAFDGQVHVFRADGSVQPGFPVTIVAPVLWRDSADAQPSMIMTSPAIGDANGDGIPDIAVGSNEYGSDSNTGAIHLIHGDGNLHEGGAAHPNWPVVVTSLNLFPFVGRGTSAAVAMADVNGDGRPDLAVTGNAGTVDVLDGIQPARAPGEDPLRIVRLDSAQRGPLSDLSDPVDRPLLNTFATGSFGDLDQDGVPDFITGGAGLKLAVNLGGGWENEPFAHQVGVWTTRPNDLNGRGNFLPGFPRRIEDYLFFMNPTSADVSGDGYPEVVVGSGGYYVHAWDGCGEEAPGFPKFVGSWVIATPALGDIDGDGLLEVVTATRAGYLFAFDTDGPADGSITWPEWRHDGHNTGNFEAALSNGGQKRGAAEPLECEIPEPMRDAGVPTEEDAGTSDSDAGPPGVSGGGGCGCRTTSEGAPTAGLFFLAALLVRRRRR
ncbi:MAG: VCBS repeat-containing protein [Sandaracinus sp.]|nr:VCBS repeat-containing protein [Sandaracinus sp.]MCB9611125.1 VCBS repeat-containing protein [Sandaracinus sp.]MCB9623848.1 VCBS repeat-containing protein [Sandaracinus sp.]